MLETSSVQTCHYPQLAGFTHNATPGTVTSGTDTDVETNEWRATIAKVAATVNPGYVVTTTQAHTVVQPGARLCAMAQGTVLL